MNYVFSRSCTVLVGFQWKGPSAMALASRSGGPKRHDPTIFVATMPSFEDARSFYIKNVFSKPVLCSVFAFFDFY